MKKSTVGELLDGKLDAGGYRIYVVRDGDTVFYVGQSGDVCNRLWGHLGQGTWGRGLKSSLGRLIDFSLPVSRNWQIELYAAGELSPVSGYSVEETLIGNLRPCLNVACNPNPSKLPDRYVDHAALDRSKSDERWRDVESILNGLAKVEIQGRLSDG